MQTGIGIFLGITLNLVFLWVILTCVLFACINFNFFISLWLKSWVSERLYGSGRICREATEKTACWDSHTCLGMAFSGDTC